MKKNFSAVLLLFYALFLSDSLCVSQTALYIQIQISHFVTEITPK